MCPVFIHIFRYLRFIWCILKLCTIFFFLQAMLPVHVNCLSIVWVHILYLNSLYFVQCVWPDSTARGHAVWWEGHLSWCGEFSHFNSAYLVVDIITLLLLQRFHSYTFLQIHPWCKCNRNIFHVTHNAYMIILTSESPVPDSHPCHIQGYRRCFIFHSVQRQYRNLPTAKLITNKIVSKIWIHENMNYSWHIQFWDGNNLWFFFCHFNRYWVSPFEKVYKKERESKQCSVTNVDRHRLLHVHCMYTSTCYLPVYVQAITYDCLNFCFTFMYRFEKYFWRKTWEIWFGYLESWFSLTTFPLQCIFSTNRTPLTRKKEKEEPLNSTPKEALTGSEPQD